MSRFLDWISAVAFGTATYLLSMQMVHAQDLPHPLTIADCPAGYVLAVQDTADPQPVTHSPPQNEADMDTSTSTATADVFAKQMAEAPRRFVTGCVPKQPQ